MTPSKQLVPAITSFPAGPALLDFVVLDLFIPEPSIKEQHGKPENSSEVILIMNERFKVKKIKDCLAGRRGANLFIWYILRLLWCFLFLFRQDKAGGRV